MKVLEKLPLDWEQVLTVWVIASAILLAAILMFRLLPRFLYPSIDPSCDYFCATNSFARLSSGRVEFDPSHTFSSSA